MIQTLPLPLSSPTSRKGEAAESLPANDLFAALLATGNGPVEPQTPATASAFLGLTVGLNAAAKDAGPITLTQQALPHVTVAAPAPAVVSGQAAPIVVPGQAADAIPAAPLLPSPVPVLEGRYAAPVVPAPAAPKPAAPAPQAPPPVTVMDDAAFDVPVTGATASSGASNEAPAPSHLGDLIGVKADAKPAEPIEPEATNTAWSLGTSALWLQAAPTQPAVSPVASNPVIVRALIEPTAARPVLRPTPVVHAPSPAVLAASSPEQSTEILPDRPIAPPAAGPEKTAAEALLEAVPAKPTTAKEALPLAPDTLAPPADGPGLSDLPPIDVAAGPAADLAPTAETVDTMPARRSVPVADLPLEVVRAARDGVERLEVRLHPEDLGTVDVKVETGRDAKTHVTIAVERPETLNLLHRDTRMIERMIAAQGLDLGGGIQMELRQQGDGNAGGRHGSNGFFSHKNGDVGTTDATDVPARFVSDRLYDLHV